MTKNMMAAVMSTVHFWLRVKEIIVNCSLSSESVKEFIFGILSKLDIEFGPIIYDTDDLDELRNKMITNCLVSRKYTKRKFASPLHYRIKELIHKIENNKTKNILSRVEKDFIKLDTIKNRIIPKCPGIRRCRGEAECKIENALAKELIDFISNQNN